MDSTHEELKHKKIKLGSEDNGLIGYGLRENPKKSWKFSGFKEVNISASASAAVSASSMEESQCKVCGKEFVSMKALYGHMRHHSGSKRRRVQCKECEKSFLSLKSLTNHMRVHAQKLRVHNDQSETTSSNSRQDLVVESLYVKKKRSKRINRFKYINAICSISSLNESLPSFSETDDQEIEQVAVCLMMLSKGVHNWGELHSLSEFSDDDDQAVSFEVKSLDQERILTNDGDEFLEMKKPREKLDACASDSFTVLYEQIKKNDDELDVCVERLYKCSEFEMPKLDSKSGFVSYDTEIEKGIVVELKFGSSEVESCEDSMEEAGLGIINPSSSSKKVSFDACDSEFGADSCNKVKCSGPESEMVDDCGQIFRIKCKTCNKMFHSRQALAGHQRKHSTRKGCKAQKFESWEEENRTGVSPKTEADCKLVKLECVGNLMEGETSGPDVKEHKCHICFKEFITGQALGGHKRAHFLKNSETRPQENAMSQDHSTISDALDINIPIMLDQQDNGDVGFKQWWVGRNCEPEPLVAN